MMLGILTKGGSWLPGLQIAKNERCEMETDTIKLLEEIDLGCEMAENSFRQIQNYGMADDLAGVIKKYQKKHEEIQKEASRLLHEEGGRDKNPNPMAEAMSWISTEMKMMLKKDGTQIAKLMMDGCNMGIQSIGEKLSQYTQASKEAQALGKKLVKTEEEFLSEVKEFL